MSRSIALIALAVLSTGVGFWAGRGSSGSGDSNAEARDALSAELGRRLTAQQGLLEALVLEVRTLRQSSEDMGESSGATDGAGVGSPLPQRRAEISMDDSPTLGPLSAPVTIVEFSDFACPHCATMASVLRKVVRAYPQDVRVIFKHCPLPTHRGALEAHKASIAAWRQGRFREMYDYLFAHQSMFDEAGLKQSARTLGLNLEQFEEDLAGEDLADRIATDRGEATAAGITRVPTFFVNGLKLEGAQTYEVLRVEIEAEIRRLASVGKRR